MRDQETTMGGSYYPYGWQKMKKKKWELKVSGISGKKQNRTWS